MHSTDRSGQVTWTTVRYMISEIQYGGRITDDWDRLQMNVFTEKFFKQEVSILCHVIRGDMHIVLHGIDRRTMKNKAVIQVGG